LEGYIFLNRIRGKLQFLKHLREKKWLVHFPGQLPEPFASLFRKQLFFFSLPPKLVVRGLILEKFLEGNMGFVYFILGIEGKFGNFTIVQI
jgi:hypothetical protein